jgi:hypothetical protein
MTLTIELPSAIEAELVAQARSRHLELTQYIELLLQDQVAPPVERAAAWRASTRDLPHTPRLSDEAISRETI